MTTNSVIIKTLKALATAGLATGLTVGVASSAAYAGPSAPPKPPAGAGLAAWQQAVDTRIELRLATLSGLKIAVNAATNLTAGERSTLAAVVGSDTTNLTALRRKTDGETTVAAVRADGRSMIVDYRVYMLVVPKVRLTIAADTETNVLTRLQTVHDKLVQVAGRLQAQGKDTGVEMTQLADLASKIAAAGSTLDGQIARLLAVAPSADAGAMQAATGPVRTAVRDARDDIRSAIAAARQIRNELQRLAS